MLRQQNLNPFQFEAPQNFNSSADFGENKFWTREMTEGTNFGGNFEVPQTEPPPQAQNFGPYEFFDESTGLLQGTLGPSARGRGRGSFRGGGDRKEEPGHVYRERGRGRPDGPPRNYSTQSSMPDDIIIYGEALSPCGKTYYYHKKTREVTWIRPQGPNIKIVRHWSLNLAPGNLPPQAQPNLLPPINLSVPPPNLAPGGVTPQLVNQNVPFIPPEIFQQQPAMQTPAATVNPFGAAAAASQVNPMMNYPQSYAFMPQWGYYQMDPSQLPTPTPSQSTNPYDWTAHMSPEGKTYYFNSETHESVWDKPAILVEFEARKKLLEESSSAQVKQTNLPAAPKAKVEKKTPLAQVTTKVEKKGGVIKCRPISSTAVPGTSWFVVWTGDKKVFFHHRTNKMSVWEKPPELLGRFDVDEMIKVCPVDNKHLAKVKKVEATSTTDNRIKAK